MGLGAPKYVKAVSDLVPYLRVDIVLTQLFSGSFYNCFVQKKQFKRLAYILRHRVVKGPRQSEDNLAPRSEKQTIYRSPST